MSNHARTPREVHSDHQYEAIRARQQAKHDQQIVDERALAARRIDSLVQEGAVEDADFPGCVW